MIAQGNLGAKRALAELRKISRNAYQAAVDAQTGPQVREDFSKGKPSASYTKKRAMTPTVPRVAAKGPDVDYLKSVREAYGDAE